MMATSITNQITSGSASRYIKKNWLNQKLGVDATAFDLRDCTPPETYVSFYLVKGDDNEAKINSAILEIGKKRSIKNGAITVLEIETCLKEINDEKDELIIFREQGIPHCGLYYLTNDLTKITEIKNTLSFLASECFYVVPPSDKNTLKETKTLISQ
ncbi:hypothetical protein [Laribacter hongkongensis]|uniref:Uncharacterized protein n=1 Tax=Laribacter hongkongensis TaxID=168471 RepID=A0ABD4SUC1_9NEIS|nr:hypothetical protein [Laribacter hongkongensis]MCG9027069.1 hypothetical protein [Laribacter hongkongensis]